MIKPAVSHFLQVIKMARLKKKVNKSQLVRDMLEKEPGLGIKDVVAKMGEQGHTISPNLVYFVKGKMSGKKKRKKRIAKAASAAVSQNGAVVKKTDAVALIRDVKELAGRAGGYEKLKELVAALAE